MPRWLVAAVVPVSVLAIASVHTATLLVIAPFVLLAGFLMGARERRWPLPVLILLALAGYTALQAIPLPVRLVDAVSPEAAREWAGAFRPLEQSPPAWVSLSLAPSQTAIEALKWLTYGCMFLVAARMPASGTGRSGRLSFVSAVVFLTALAVAVVTVAHGAVHASRVYGFYEPGFEPGRWSVGPVLNPNNLAGYLNLGVFCGLGLVIARRTPGPRLLLGIGVAVLIGASILTASRGGVLALSGGGVLFVLLVVRRRGLSSRRRSEKLPFEAQVALVVSVVGGGVLAILGATRATWHGLSDKAVDKLLVIQWAEPLLEDYPLFGVGRGAFGTVFSAYDSPLEHRVYSYAENFVVQWASEWGVPVALLALVSFGWSLRPHALGATKKTMAAGAFAGCTALVVQNLVDVALEVPAVCLCVASLLGAAWGDANGQEKEEVSRLDVVRFSSKMGTVAGAVAGAVTWAVVASIGAPTPAQAREMLSRRVAATTTAGQIRALRQSVRDMVVRFPADPYFPRLGGLLAWKTDQGDPFAWIANALERDMTNGRTHLLLARILASRGIDHQALLHAKLAAQHDPTMLGRAASLVAGLTKDFPRIERAVPAGREGGKMLFEIALRLRGPGDEKLRRLCLEHALERNPDFLAPRVRLALDLISALETPTKSERCQGDRKARCLHKLREHEDKLRLRSPKNSDADEIEARILMIEGRPGEASAFLAERCSQYREPVGCLKTRVEMALAAADEQALDLAIKELRRAACPPSRRCAKAEIWVGDQLAREQRFEEALAHYRRATKHVSDHAIWRKVAEAARRAGKKGTVMTALRQVARLRGDPVESFSEDWSESALGGKTAVEEDRVELETP